MKYLLFLLLPHFSIGILNSQEYLLSVDESSIGWTGKAAFSAYSLSGSIAPKSGSIIVEMDDIREAAIIINMLTLEAENADLQKHLRSKDFFEVNRFPKSEFHLTNAESTSDSTVKIYGVMMIKEKEQTENFEILLDQSETWLSISGQIVLDRTDYGVNYNSPNVFKKLKENAIADEFVLELNLLFRIQENTD